MEANLPGVDKENLEISTDDGILTPTANQNYEDDVEKENYVYRERCYGKMCRSFSLDNIKEDKIKAKYKDGLLTIQLPKKEEEQKQRKLINID